jgi:hypothetical protein
MEGSGFPEFFVPPTSMPLILTFLDSRLYADAAILVLKKPVHGLSKALFS